MNRFLAMLAALMLLLAVTAPALAESEQGDWQTDTSPHNLTVYVNLSWFTNTWDTSVETRSDALITKETGVNVEFITPTGSESERMYTMLASGDLPDIILANVYDAGMQEMIDAGYCVPLNELADKYDKSFYDIVAPSLVSYNSDDEGNIYAYPNFASSMENVNAMMAANDIAALGNYVGDRVISVRKDIYEAIGSPDMTTPEGFIKALEMAKEQFPLVDGVPISLVGFQPFGDSGTDALWTYVQQMAGIPFYNEDGSLHDLVTDPEYIRWLKCFREAFEKNLISRDVFSDQRAQIDEKLKAGRYFVSFAGKSDISASNTYLFQDMGGKETGIYYMPVDALKNSNQGPSTVMSKLLINGWMNSYITTSCKDPARAFRFLNYMMGERGQHAIWYGIEGVTWDYNQDGIEELKPFLTDGSVSAEDLARNYNVYGNNWTWFNTDIINVFTGKIEVPFTPQQLYVDWSIPYMVHYPELTDLSLPADSPEFLIDNNIGLEWGITLTKLITAPDEAEFDQVLADFLARRDELGYAQMMEARNALVQKNKAKLDPYR
ncbi:MAG: extracellular solute-binding protein [Clostridiales bacterium]|nr:extracellular solute-binding protein [Clostridiales bacterium]